MSHFTNVEAVVFDMDGTLIEHTWTHDYLTHTWFEHFEARLDGLSHDDFYDVFWPKTVDMWYMMADHIINGNTAQHYSYLNTLRFLQKDISLAGEMVQKWDELVLEETEPFADTYEVLRAIRSHVPTGILTNGFTSLQRAKLNAYQLCEEVDVCLVSEEVGYHKPDRRAFEAVLKQLGNPAPERVIYVGDNPINDIEGALGAGIQPVFMNLRGRSQIEGVIEIKALQALLDLLPF